MEKKGSVGVRIIAITQMAVGIIPLLILIFSSIQVKFDKTVLNDPNPLRGESLAWGFSILLVLAILHLPLILFGIGLLRNKNWARICSIILSPFLLSIFLLFVGGLTGVVESFNTTLCLALSFVLYLMYIYFFTRPKVKQQFK